MLLLLLLLLVLVCPYCPVPRVEDSFLAQKIDVTELIDDKYVLLQFMTLNRQQNYERWAVKELYSNRIMVLKFYIKDDFSDLWRQKVLPPLTLGQLPRAGHGVPATELPQQPTREAETGDDHAGTLRHRREGRRERQ